MKEMVQEWAGTPYCGCCRVPDAQPCNSDGQPACDTMRSLSLKAIKIGKCLDGVLWLTRHSSEKVLAFGMLRSRITSDGTQEVKSLEEVASVGTVVVKIDKR